MSEEQASEERYYERGACIYDLKSNLFPKYVASLFGDMATAQRWVEILNKHEQAQQEPELMVWTAEQYNTHPERELYEWQTTYDGWVQRDCTLDLDRYIVVRREPQRDTLTEAELDSIVEAIAVSHGLQAAARLALTIKHLQNDGTLE